MKNFLKEFKEFALKGNVMDMAVGVIIGAAFGNIVTALTENIINPLIGCIGNPEVEGLKISLAALKKGQYMDIGAFLTAIINFVIMAFCLFLIMRSVNKMMALGKKKTADQEAAEPTVKICPHCQSEINIKATRCPFCTSELAE